ncbi:hypothetical protein N7528_003667 [Penicillium herquei]|nr:hypothetical protein N7528_003667 [Penicillium herquei]
MGGAPLRSKGCNTCRKRKVKCDLQRPECARCLRGSYRCEGYERDRKFINAFADSEPEKSPKNIIVPQKKAEDAHITVINVNSQIRSQLFSLFIDSYIPSPPVGHINLRCQQATNVIEGFPSLMDGKNSQLFDRAISALASTFVGKKFNDSRLTYHGVMLYNHAIQAFAALIPQSKLPVQEVLCANIVFQLYEVINCTYGFAGWMAHMQGANAVLARHEKSLKRNQLSTMVLRQLKLSNIFHAIGKSQSALASFPMWRYLSPPKPDDPLDEIIDILMECTILIEEAGCVRCEQDAANVIQSSYKLKYHAQSWHNLLMATSEDPLYSLVPDESQAARLKTKSKVFPEKCEFISIDMAEAFMLYWTAMLVINSILYEFDLQNSSQGNDEPDPDTSINQKSPEMEITSLAGQDALFFADQICRGVGYFVQPHMHILGGHNLLFPLPMSSQFFHRHGFYDRYEWCQDVFATLESMGLGLANVLQGTPWLTYENQNPP